MTDENGEICLDGENYELFFNEVYHVQEIEPPEDYGAVSFDYVVTLTDEMQLVNYGQFIYHYSDSMQIKNWPLEGLVVEKQVESGIPADKDRYYTFRISVLNEDGSVNTDYNEKHGDDQFENGVFEFQLKDKEQKMFKDFLKGTEYLVEELDADGFTVSVSYNIYDESGNIIYEKTDVGSAHTGELTQEDEVIVFKNSKKGDLKVSKKLVSNEAADADREFTFLVKLDDESITGEYGDMTFTKGAAAVKLKGGESATAEGLPAGITYTVTEEETGGFTLTSKPGDTGTITMENDSEAVFTNTRDIGDLEVKKILESDAAADADREFEFTVILGKLGDNSINGTYGDMTFTEGTATLKLKGGESATAAGLPAGITYTVTEADAQGFELVGKTGDTGTIQENKAQAVFTNARTGSLSTQFEARKTMKGRELEEGDVYSFRLFDAAGNTLQEKRNDSSGKVTFDPIVFTASDLPAVSSDNNAEREKPLTWRIREVIPEGAADNVKDGIKYDASEYSVTVTLSYDYETGKYAVSDPVYKAGKEAAEAAEFINEDLRDFEFSKVWTNSGKEIKWPERVAGITVTLKRTAHAADGSPSVEETAVFTATPDGITENAGSGFAAHAEKLPGEGYRYRISSLARYSSDGTEWSYSISETTVEGFNKPAYYTINADGVKGEQLSSEKTSFASPGMTGGVEIVNDEIVAVIPSTGGPGTMRYTLSGAVLLIASAMMYIFRMRRRTVMAPRRQ